MKLSYIDHIGTEHTLLNRQQIITHMLNKNESEWTLDLHCPMLFKYNSQLLRENELYYINNEEKEITLYIE